MLRATRSSRTLVIVGLIAMLAGVLDPLEGSVVILAGIAMATLGAVLCGSAHRRIMYAALALAAVGVGLLWALSAVGGFGGNTGRSMWWALVLLPYPIGWVAGLIGTIRVLREGPHMALSHG